MRQRRKPARPWWQVTDTAHGAFGMAIGWLVVGALGVLTGIGWRSTIGVASGVGFLALGATQIFAGIKLRRADGA